MAEVTRRLEIAAPADRVWATIADFAAVARYSPMVRECQLEGPDGVGQLRHLTLDDDTVTTSRLVALDPAARALRYEIVRLVDLYSDRTLIGSQQAGLNSQTFFI